MNIKETIELRQFQNKLLGDIYSDLLLYLAAIRKQEYLIAAEKAAKISRSTDNLLLGVR